MRITEIIESFWNTVDQQFPVPKNKPEMFNIMINGKIWMKNGRPIELSRGPAQKAADSITAKYNRTTQIVPVKSF